MTSALSSHWKTTWHCPKTFREGELALMRSGEHDVVRAYVLYRERRHS